MKKLFITETVNYDIEIPDDIPDNEVVDYIEKNDLWAKFPGDVSADNYIISELKGDDWRLIDEGN